MFNIYDKNEWHLCLEVRGGLSNRILAISYLYQIKERLNNNNLQIVWPFNLECGCKIEDIFDINDSFQTVNYVETGKRDAVKTVVGRAIKKLYRCSCNRVYNFLELKSLSENQGEDALIKRLNEESVYFDAYLELGELDRRSLSWVRPSSSVLEKEGAVLGRINKNTIGVHIRRTDHIEAIRYSPISAFVNEMNALLKVDSNINFFLATDDIESEAYIKNTFPNESIITLENRSYTRTKKEGIQDALIDIMSLSKCRMILGSYNSSFSRISSMMGGIELRTMVK